MNKRKKAKISKDKYWFQTFISPKVLTFIAVIIIGGGVVWFGQLSDERNEVLAAIEVKTILPEMTVYKSATCNCCQKWVSYLENEGFIVKSHNRKDMNTVKKSLGVIPGLASCHTAIIGGYVIEGHVPANDIIRLLTEKPEGVVGLTAPGMPQHSPGMQPLGKQPKDYDVLAFDEKGNTQLFHSY